MLLSQSPILFSGQCGRNCLRCSRVRNAESLSPRENTPSVWFPRMRRHYVSFCAEESSSPSNKFRRGRNSRIETGGRMNTPRERPNTGGGQVSESIANQSPWEYALQGLTPPGFSAHRPVRQVHLRDFWIAKIQRRRNPMSAANKAIIRRLYEEVWNQRKLELINEIISPATLSKPPMLRVPPLAQKPTSARFCASWQATPICAGPSRT